MTRAILADDLTGALDAGLQAHNAGFSVRTVFDLRHAELDDRAFADEGLASQLPAESVLCLDTETRNASPEEVRSQLSAALRLLTRSGSRLVYKKIDSTLRGRIAWELSIVLERTDLRTVVVAPALPSLARTTVNGVHFVHGVPLADTEFASDATLLRRSSRVAELIAAPHVKVETLEIAVVREDPGALEAFVCGGDGSKRLIVADAETDEDLDAIARACASCPEYVLPCGSAGLYAALNKVAAAPRFRAGLMQCADEGRREHCAGVVISGSTSRVTKEQIGRLSGRESTVVLSPDRRELREGDLERESLRLAELAAEALGAGESVVLDCAGSPGDEPAELRARYSARIQQSIAVTARRVLELADVGGLVLTGGDTALAVCAAVGATSLSILCEAAPFMPASVLRGGPYDGLPVVTKAGGFGKQDALLRALAYVEGAAFGVERRITGERQE